MRRTTLAISGATALVFASVIGGPVSTASTSDPNTSTPSGQVPALVAQPRAGLPTIAQLRMSAPATATAIDPAITNLSAASTVGAQSLQVLILDCFGALKKQGLTIDTATAAAPPGGTATVTTGNDADDVGPLVVAYTGFDDNESAGLTMDPDTFDNPSFGAVRGDMAGCNVEAVFSGGLRAQAKITRTTSGVMVANLKQRNP